MPKFHYIDPYTDKWWKARRGKPTASQFHRIFTPGGKKSDQQKKYMYELIAEKLLDETMKKDDQTFWMERGSHMEAEAIEAFQQTKSLILKRVGFVTTNDERIGCSPDCLVEGSVQAVEIKCPAPWTQIGYLLNGVEDDKYKPQVQGQLLIGGWDTVHFFAYHPQMPAFHLKTHPDRFYQEAMAEEIYRFCGLLDHETERARSKGVYHVLQQIAEAG
jgi:hypothetical protein